jgi:hypothetical protein
MGPDAQYSIYLGLRDSEYSARNMRALEISGRVYVPAGRSFRAIHPIIRHIPFGMYTEQRTHLSSPPRSVRLARVGTPGLAAISKAP